jgi:hypothetical protein
MWYILLRHFVTARTRICAVSLGPARSEAHFATAFIFLYHAAMTENRELTAAIARLDRLTDWGRRPRSKMRVGLEPKIRSHAACFDVTGLARRCAALEPKLGSRP